MKYTSELTEIPIGNPSFRGWSAWVRWSDGTQLGVSRLLPVDAEPVLKVWHGDDPDSLYYVDIVPQRGDLNA